MSSPISPSNFTSKRRLSTSSSSIQNLAPEAKRIRTLPPSQSAMDTTTASSSSSSGTESLLGFHSYSSDLSAHTATSTSSITAPLQLFLRPDFANTSSSGQCAINTSPTKKLETAAALEAKKALYEAVKRGDFFEVMKVLVNNSIDINTIKDPSFDNTTLLIFAIKKYPIHRNPEIIKHLLTKMSQSSEGLMAINATDEVDNSALSYVFDCMFMYVDCIPETGGSIKSIFTLLVYIMTLRPEGRDTINTINENGETVLSKAIDRCGKHLEEEVLLPLLQLMSESSKGIKAICSIDCKTGYSVLNLAFDNRLSLKFIRKIVTIMLQFPDGVKAINYFDKEVDKTALFAALINRENLTEAGEEDIGEDIIFNLINTMSQYPDGKKAISQGNEHTLLTYSLNSNLVSFNIIDKLLQTLLQFPEGKESINFLDEQNKSALSSALLTSDPNILSIARRLAQHMCQSFKGREAINTPDDEGDTALSLAAEYSHTDIVETILTHMTIEELTEAKIALITREETMSEQVEIDSNHFLLKEIQKSLDTIEKAQKYAKTKHKEHLKPSLSHKMAESENDFFIEDVDLPPDLRSIVGSYLVVINTKLEAKEYLAQQGVPEQDSELKSPTALSKDDEDDYKLDSITGLKVYPSSVNNTPVNISFTSPLSLSLD